MERHLVPEGLSRPEFGFRDGVCLALGFSNGVGLEFSFVIGRSFRVCRQCFERRLVLALVQITKGETVADGRGGGSLGYRLLERLEPQESRP